MRLRATILKFLLFSCAFGVVGNDCFATTIASKSFVDSRIENTGSAVEIKTTANTPATLSQNPQSAASIIAPNGARAKEVTTIGWTDANRTSKVRSGSSSSTTLVDMWIE